MAAEPNLIRRHRLFRRFWLARAVSLIGDGAAMVALVLLVSRGEHAGTAVSLILLAESVPRFFGPLAGALADRMGVRRLLIAAELVQAAVFGVIVLARPGLVVLVPLVAVAAAASTVFSAAGRTVVPRLVDEADLMPANAWMGTAFNLQAALGPVLGGVFSAWGSAYGALAINAGTFLVSALLLTRIPALEPLRTGERRTLLGDTVEGLKFVRHHRVARAIVLLLLLGLFFGSLDNLALVFLAEHSLNTGETGFGVLSASFGVAMVAASLWLVRAAESRSPVWVLLAGWFFTGLGLLLTAAAPVLFAAIAMQLIAGLGNGVANVGEETLLQKAVPAEVLGRVGGTLSSAAFFGSTAGYLAGSLLSPDGNPRLVFVIAGGGIFLALALCGPALLSARAALAAAPAEDADADAPEADQLPAAQTVAQPVAQPGGAP
ncbi:MULTISPECIES: MFS transporter [unclassified Streptomyces]|uniref:MFS transporter n=1 Tax=unclassified Streptomyces TaxID=2593676 RepID=UPI002258FB3C|nr:MFS transporter [Streptomyces sp. NBC_00047]MCX5612892.1 MFS transporter [Streptomyces sp. NBC_00047]